MATLPSEADLGGISGAASGRPIAQVDTTGYSRGAAALARGAEADAEATARSGAVMAEGMRGFGAGLASAGRDVAAVAFQRQHEDDAFEYTKARANFITGKIRRDSDLQQDQDIGTLEQRYQTDLGNLRDQSLSMVRNEKLRAKLGVEIADDYERGVASTRQFAFKKTADAEIGRARDDLNLWSEQALVLNDEAEKAKLVKAGADRIAGLHAKGYISAENEQSFRQAWIQDYGAKWLASKSPEERLRLTAPAASGDGVVDRIIGVESGGKANAQNPNSTARGLGQFIDGTWLELVREARPELASRSDRELIALKDDPRLSREMTALYAKKNGEYLQGQGLDASPQNVYLAHFLGPETAARVLKASPNTPVSELVGAAAVKSNPSILAGKTAGSVVAWAGDKMGGAGRTGTPADFVPFAQRMQVHRQAQQEIMQGQAVASSQRGEEFERQILDAAAGTGALPSRAAIEGDPLLSAPKRNEVLRQYDSAAGDVATYQRVLGKYNDPNAGGFNPFDKAERDAVDKIYKTLGGNAAALDAVIGRTGIVPKTAVAEMRGSLASNDPQRVASAANLASNMMVKNPTIFAGVDGASELENAGVKMRQYVERFGFTAEQAGRRIIEENTPEYKAKISARIKNEDVGEIIKKRVSIDDMRGAFDDSWWPGKPQVEFTAESRQSAYSDYLEMFRDRYMETGDVDVSKQQAANQLKKVWGVSKVSGKDTVMRFPPDRAPAMAGIEDPAGKIALQAQEAIKGFNGQDVPRDKIMLTPLAGGQTAGPYFAGEPPPYALSWFDKNGTLQMLNPGQAFVADPAALRKSLTEQRRVSFDREREIAEFRRIEESVRIPGVP